jgi:hypothetical protein
MCMFCRSLFVLLSFSFGHCVVCSSIYGFWLLLWYLQTPLPSSISSISWQEQVIFWWNDDDDICFVLNHMLSWIFIVLAHWNNNPCIEMSLPIVNFPLCTNIPATPAYGLVRNDMDVNEKLFSITHRHKVGKGPAFLYLSVDTIF